MRRFTFAVLLLAMSVFPFCGSSPSGTDSSIVCGPPHYCARTDITTAPLTQVPNVGNLLGANTLVRDPDFANRIVRLTDWNTFGSGGPPNSNFAVDCSGGAESNFMSPDDTKFYVCGTGGSIAPFTFDPSTLQATRMYISNFPSTNGMVINTNSSSPEWSFAQNNVMYDIENSCSAGKCTGPILKSYDFTDQSTPPSPATLFDFTANSACHASGDSFSGAIGWTEDVTVSKDDQTFVTSVSITGGVQGTATYINVWNRTKGCAWYNTQTGQVGGQWGTAGTIGIGDRYYIHNARLSKDGNWVKIGFSTCISNCTIGIQNYFWQVATTNVETCSISDKCLGHQALGYTHLINSPTTPSQQSQLIRSLSNLKNQTELWTNGPPSHMPWDNHQSWENANSADSTPYLSSSWTGGLISYAWDMEIDGFSTDGSGVVYRFAHNFGTGQATFFSGRYLIGSVSQDGKFFAWSSDWRGSLGSTRGSNSCAILNCRSDAFLVELR